MKNTKLIFILLALLAMQMVPTQMQSQLKLGYEYSYDSHEVNHEQFGHGSRVKREGKIVQLKSADTTMTETTVGYFNIRIYPNPTKGQLTLNIAELGRNDKVQMFLYDFIGNELSRMDFSKLMITKPEFLLKDIEFTKTE